MGEFYLERSIANKLEDLGIDERIIKLNYFKFGGSKFDFPYFAKETMQRYKQSNQELYKLKLRIQINDDDYVFLATQLITDALNLSAKKLDIVFYYPQVSSKTYWSQGQQKPFVLPGQVFESTTLKELVASSCIIDKPVSDSVPCSTLVSLNLTGVTIRDDVMRDILARCPLIEYLDLHECEGLTKISIGKMQLNLKHCLVEDLQNECFVDFFEEGFTQFQNMISLVFRELDLEKNFFHNSKFKFPCLTDLSLHDIHGLEETVHIFLPSLKYLYIENLLGSTLFFNVPNIRKFRCWGYTDSPPLNIITSSNEWESADIELVCLKDPPRSWFLGLREFLQNLRVSKKISLCLKFDYYCEDEPCDDKLTEEDISGVSSIPVETLFIEDLLECGGPSLLAFSNIMSGLFFTCRPNFITLTDMKCESQLQPCGSQLPDLLKLLRESVTEQSSLKQVTFEISLGIKEPEEWRPFLWDDLIASVSLETQHFQVRLKLEWQ